MTITATEFKAKCLQILDQVNRTGEVVTITKRGQVVAELRAPYEAKPVRKGPGMAKGEMVIVGDIMEPIDVQWDALK
ncbi:MAG: type II toxin-antitoxin system prevent-host-death family antitoxin [Fimbriimonas sp.]|nr:type II toxin-antitoxin system prevent-host-death family antitoxin [Fimbriimonas sp.]